MKNRNVAYWLCQLAGWGTYTGFSIWGVALAGVWNRRVLVSYAIFFACALLLSHLLRREIRRRDWLSLPVRKATPRLAAAAIVTGLLSTLQVIGVSVITGNAADWNRFSVFIMTLSLSGAFLMWTLFYVSITTARHALEMRLNLREAQLRALENQVNPHFLFNSLNTIRGMIVEDASLAQDMVTRLANILRYSLQRERTFTVPLWREMEVVADYLAIESIRFDDRLTVHMEIQPAAAQAQVPAMLVQTLVENAVKHGIGARVEGGEILIRASIQNSALAIEIVNSGQLTAPHAQTTQIGLTNARERLRLLYGAQAKLQLENRGSAEVAAMVSIPA